MANRRGYVERDRHGRERVVIERRPSHRRSSSHSHQVTTQELLNDAEERIAELELDNGTLRQQLSFAQSQAWETRGVQTNYQTLQTAYNQLRDEHHHCRHLRGQLEANLREVDRLEDKLDNEEKRNEKLEEKVRLMKRGSGEREQYRRQYEEKSAECELIRRRCAEKDEFVRLGEVRIAQKDRTISELRAVLRNYGLRILS